MCITEAGRGAAIYGYAAGHHDNYVRTEEQELEGLTLALTLPPTSMQTSGSSVPSTDKDAISDYLFQTLIKGNDCARPTQACDTAQIDLAEQGLRVSPDVFTQSHPLVQKIILRSGVHALISVLGCKCEGPTLTKLVNDLSPKLEEVFNGQVETLRPLLDILSELQPSVPPRI